MEKNIASKLVQLELENRRKAIKLADEIIPVVRKWDGKVFNKRFINALEAVNPHLSIDTQYGYFRIEYWCEKDHIVNGKGIAIHVRERYLQLNTTQYSDQRYDDAQRALTAERRIRADVIITAIENQKKYFEETIASVKEKGKDIPMYEERIQKAKDLIESVNDECPSLLSYYYELYYTVRRL